jgi:hypothetical protein
VFDQPPGGVGLIGSFGAAEVGREVGGRLVEFGVGVAAFEEGQEMVAEGIDDIHEKAFLWWF